MDHPLHDRDLDDLPTPPPPGRPWHDSVARREAGSLDALVIKLLEWAAIGYLSLLIGLYVVVVGGLPFLYWSRLAAEVLSEPRPDPAWLLGLVQTVGGPALLGLGARSAWARFRRSRREIPAGGRAVAWRRLAFALGLSGGAMPGALWAVLALGLLAGSGAAFEATSALLSRHTVAPDPEQQGYTLIGAGTVRGTITTATSQGPFTYRRSENGGMSSGGGTLSLGPGEPCTIHLANRGTVWGRDLVAASDDRGLVLPEPQARWPLYLEGLAGVWLNMLVVVACAAVAAGRAIGPLLLRTWAVAFLAWSALLTRWIPTAIDLQGWIPHVYPVAVLVVLQVPSVRAYLARRPALASGGLAPVGEKTPIPEIA